MSEMSAIPQNQLAGVLAAILKGGKDALNYPGKLPESVPLLGGMGAGDLVFGKGPELMEDMSYGFPPYKGTGMATKVDPRTVDLALAPGMGTAASLVLRGGKAAPKAIAKAIKPAEGEVLYRAGDGAFFNADKAAVDQFGQAFGGKVGAHRVIPRRSASDADVESMAKRLGMYQEGTPVGQYLEQGDNAVFDNSAQLVEELRNMGFDSARINDGLSKHPSLVALDPSIVQPAEEFAGAGRRDFMKKAAGLTAGGVAAAVTPDMLMQALKKAPALAGKEAIPAAAVQAAKSAWTPELIRSAIPKLSMSHMGGDAVHYTDELADAIKKRYATPDEFINEQKAMERWSEGDFDVHTPESNAAIKAELEAHPDYNYQDPSYGVGWDKYNEIRAKHQPTPRRDKWYEGVDWLQKNYPVEELDRIIKSGKYPTEWAAKGITPEQVAYTRFPITGPGYSPVRPEDELVDALYRHAEMAVDKLDHPNTIQPGLFEGM